MVSISSPDDSFSRAVDDLDPKMFSVITPTNTEDRPSKTPAMGPDKYLQFGFQE